MYSAYILNDECLKSKGADSSTSGRFIILIPTFLLKVINSFREKIYVHTFNFIILVAFKQGDLPLKIHQEGSYKLLLCPEVGFWS